MATPVRTRIPVDLPVRTAPWRMADGSAEHLEICMIVRTSLLTFGFDSVFRMFRVKNSSPITCIFSMTRPPPWPATCALTRSSNPYAAQDVRWSTEKPTDTSLAHAAHVARAPASGSFNSLPCYRSPRRTLSSGKLLPVRYKSTTVLLLNVALGNSTQAPSRNKVKRKNPAKANSSLTLCL